MHIWEYTLLIVVGSFFAGLLGSLTGLGGGVVIVPLLVILFHVDIRYAAGASLISVIATSSGAAAAYVKEGYSNIRIGMFLEVATTSGAVAGAFLAAHLKTNVIEVVFGLVLLYSAYLSARPRPHDDGDAHLSGDRLANRLKLSGTFPDDAGGETAYSVTNVPAGFGLMVGAGVLSGLLGIGSGAVKVLAMDRAMRIPFKVSTTTSNFMIGVTAAASAGVYLTRGYVAPGLAMPVMLGALAGSFAGSRLLVRTHVGALRLVFGLVILALAVEMIANGLGGNV